jgi:hypothetical protein
VEKIKEMENIIKLAGQYGALGLILLASFWFINKKDNEYNLERKEQVSFYTQQTNRMIDVVEKNSIALSELATIIKNRQ